MYIKSLELNNFRNYEKLNIKFDDGTNILYGDNAQGKTNILESIYFASTTKSHRLNKDKDLIKINKYESHIKVIIEKNKIETRLDFHIKKNRNKGVAPTKGQCGQPKHTFLDPDF